MANRPVYVAGDGGSSLLSVEHTEFVWVPGLSKVQKQKSTKSLHGSFRARHPGKRILEISGKSPDELGVRLSAFNLPFTLTDGRTVSVECAYQAGKVLDTGGPYTDLLEKTSREAKTDSRLKCGSIIAFELEGRHFPNRPINAFYDWLYLSALVQNPELTERLLEFDAFTDIVFNPAKSANCQARAAALFVGLSRAGKLEAAMRGPEAFWAVVYGQN